MINFSNLFKNWFNTPKISDDNLKKFTQKHLQQAAAKNTSGLFTTLITDTTLAYTGYFGKITDADLAEAIQQSLTMSADNLIATFKQSASQQEGLIRSLYGKDSPAYQEFYPYGVTEYSNANKANVETLMTRMVNSGNNHSADVGAAFINLFTTIKSNYLTARTAQLLKIAEVGSERTQVHTTRDVVELQLCKNVHYVGFQFPGDVDECLDFFDQSIINYDINSDNDERGQIVGVVTKNGLPVPDATGEFIGENVNNFHTKANGDFRSVYLTAAQNHTLKVTLPTGETQTKTVLVNDAGVTQVDFEF